MNEQGMRNLCAAIIHRAVLDWKLTKDAGFARAGLDVVHLSEVKLFLQGDYAEELADAAHCSIFSQWVNEVVV